ncbi:TonB-linked outer membrane protein, SusC/RagA family [Fodinibius roseus]|uniref:TonB-linked outer membrane protein, SusC/RagA family n=2 Tax=Fodinibius roseus TaxID=1194090 RepID=A0A1M5JL85_9BACT|nr:TonB-linked outer membrane protein, SusC/RagA family [Fodinibius roseus]
MDSRVIRTFGFRLQTLGVAGMICLMGLVPSLLLAQQTQTELQASLAMHEDEGLQQKDGAVADELKQSMELYLVDVSMEQALKEIAEKTDLKLMYHNALLSREKKVTLINPNITLYDALWQVLEGTGIRFGLSQNRQLVLLKMQESESNKQVQETVAGTVTDAETGEPLPAVNIAVKGTAIGTSTNEEGRYELDNVPSLQDTLLFSFIGYQSREVAIGGRGTIDVQMISQTVEGDDVVVTAFGMEREQKSLGYSTQEVGSSSLNTVKEVNVANSIQGRVAGVQVSRSSSGMGGSSSINIRGASSLTGNNQPLYVIDGVPMDNSNLDAASYAGGRDYGDGIGNINPEDIASMNVLKGPSASALYGSRGANGVVVITTKQGSTEGDRMEVSVSSNNTFDFLNVMPNYQNKWGSGYGGGYGMFGTKEVDGVEYPMFTNSMWDHWGGEMDGRMITYLALPEVGVVPYDPEPKDNVRELYRTGVTSHNNIAFSGGSGSTAYRLSLGDMRNRHIVPNSRMVRQNISLNINSAVYEDLTIDGRLNYINQKGVNRPELGMSRSGGNIMAATNELPRAVHLEWLEDWKRPDGTQRNHRQGFPNNPYWIMNEMLSEDDRRRIMGHLSITYQMTDWLSLRAKGGTDFYNDMRFERNAPGTYGDMEGSVVNNDWSVREDNFEALLMAEGDLSEDFSGSLTLGANQMKRNQEVRGFRGEQIIAEGVYDISNTQNVIPRNSIRRKRINSVFGLAQIGYKDVVYLDLTGRNDWSSTLSRGNRSFFYPSATTSLILTDLFDVNSDVLTFAKLRLSAASSGNDASPYLTNIGYSIDNSRFDGARFASAPNTIPVTELKNELTTSYEIGTDLRFFQNRLGLDFTYYTSSTTDQILPIEISHTSGYSRRYINAGEVANEGVELVVNIIPVQTSSVVWDFNINLSRNTSEVVELAEGLESLSLITQGNASIEARPGEPYGNIVGYEYVKNEEGRKILDENGQFQRSSEQAVLGNIQPDVLGGIDNTISYNNFRLGALVNFRFGGQVFSHSKYRQYTQGIGMQTIRRPEEMYMDGVIENPDGTFRENDQPVTPQTYYAFRGWSNVGEEFVIDSDYVSLRELSLGYQFGQSLLKNTPVKSARISLTARNVLYLYRTDEFELMGLAPEGTNNTSTASQGFESANMPTTRSIGININFTL